MGSVTGTNSRSGSIYLASVARLSFRRVRTRSVTAPPLPADVLPGQGLAVAKEASRRAVVGKGSTPHHARSSLCYRPGPSFSIPGAVAVRPGSTALTSTPVSSSSAASFAVRAFSAALEML